MREDHWQHVLALPRWVPQVRTAVAPVVDAAQREYDPWHYEDTVARRLDRLRGLLPGG
jgi:hypothetical protein